MLQTRDEKDIDNPGGWSLYDFQEKFNKAKEYIGHFTPAGAQVVKANSNGDRDVHGWNFFYTPWKADDFSKETYV